MIDNSLFDRSSQCFCNALNRCKTAKKQRLNIVIFDHLFQIASHKSIKGVTIRGKNVASLNNSSMIWAFRAPLANAFRCIL